MNRFLTMTPQVAEAVDVWRHAETERCAAVAAYDAYRSAALASGARSLSDPLPYDRIQDSERTLRAASEALSAALGCQNDG